MSSNEDEFAKRIGQQLHEYYTSRGLDPLSSVARGMAKLGARVNGAPSIPKRKDPRLKTAILIPYAVYTRHLGFFRDTYKPPMGLMEGFNAMASVGEPEDRELYEKHCGWAVENMETHQRVTHEGTCKGCS